MNKIVKVNDGKKLQPMSPAQFKQGGGRSWVSRIASAALAFAMLVVANNAHAVVYVSGCSTASDPITATNRLNANLNAKCPAGTLGVEVTNLTWTLSGSTYRVCGTKRCV